MNSFPVLHFTHVGIHCTDVDLMVDFYCNKLGLVIVDKGVASTGHRIFFLSQDPEIHHQVVLFDGKPESLPFNPVNQLSFLVKSIGDLRTYYNFATKAGVTNIGQVDHGNAWSIYFKDPEGNPVEVYVDSPFYSAQPCKEPLDLSQTDEEILARTEKMARNRPGFQTRADWIETTRKLIEEERVLR